MALLESIDNLTTFDQPVEDLFSHLLFALEHLGTHCNPAVALVWALVRTLNLEGIAPQWTECALSNEPLIENPAWFSYSAGGYVRTEQSANLPDKFRISAEALIGLSKIGELEDPPQHLRFQTDCLTALMRIIRDAGHHPVPSLVAYLEAVRESE